MQIKKVGVIGCGLMGRGIGEVSARAGFDVVVSEVNQQLLDKGLAAIDASLAKGVEKGKVTEADKAAAMGRIKGTINVQDFKDCDLVIEAAIENLELKKKIFGDLDKICVKDAILATNTSCLSVMDMAAVTQRQDKVLGMHFFNPVPVMKLLELVKTIATSEETLSAAKAFGQSVGKTVVTAPDVPGFIVNRLLMPFLIEAVRLIESGLATREDIDQAIVLGLNHPMGPLTLADFVGLDTAYFICNAMYDEMKENRFAPPVLLRKMVTAGQYGRKSGKGFYDYK
ncbi:MAG: 3-hydroxybutyryl-CoA dehydrogenase [Chloroflexi bacterium]|nr:3-hydroxybutyryl-CoA dehydrogenase [Chloroflexota bacterium]MBM3183580.1 3-hydroxybutyryl-CoA dehydrogenase [Chloroflexota bacterium]MBM4452113.1 3-hydroxybutyryl-CoA dehydrogenase [Chloroflexota bacterium]MBM4453895.1 3-hydroxybutyryl-CoA dehydrogenase [Chloroflexota bacterium]